MKMNSIKSLIYLYNIFLIRKVLSFGVLKHPLIRVLFVTALVVLLTVVTFSIFMFFSETLHDEQTIMFILNAYSSTIILWTLVTTMFLKIVFSRMDSFLEMTINFPVNNKERNFSIFLYETIICYMVLMLLSFSVVLSVFLLNGFEYMAVMIVNIFYASTLTYLIIQVVSKIISLILTKLKLDKVFHIVNISILVLIFTLFFREAQGLISDLSVDFVNGTNHSESLLLVLQNFHIEFGFLLTTLLYLLASSIIVIFIIVIPDDSYMVNSKYILLFSLKNEDGKQNINMFNSIIRSSTRDSNTINTIVLVYLSSFVLLSFDQSNYFLYTIVFLAFNSIYGFVQSNNLRKLEYQIHYSPVRDYASLVASQLILIYAVSTPLVITGLIIGTERLHLILPYVIATLGVFIFVMAGILFPPYNDNPFSVITSILVITVPVLLSAVVVSLMNVGIIGNLILILIFYFFVVYFSIQGLVNLKKGVRYENGSTDY